MISVDQKEKAEADARLDEGLEESFPASDPPSATREPPPASEVCEVKVGERRSEALDEALDETFPASDPPAITQPHGGDQATVPGCEDVKKP